ncbi:Protein SNQ2, partial [Candida maltosa Xu316]
SAWAIVKVLRHLAAAGQSILCTIHQPSATLFEEFDRLLLLRKGGIVTYFGDIGDKSKVILDYFERNGARHCEDDENPAEYILEAIGAGATASSNFDWGEIWANSPEKVASDKKVDELIAEGQSRHSDSTASKALTQKYATPYFYQFYYVVQRTCLTFYRAPQYIMAKMFLMTVSGLFIGFTFFGLNRHASKINAQNGAFCAFLSVVISAPAINQIQEKAI